MRLKILGSRTGPAGSKMFARYSQSAKRVLAFSLDEARARGSLFIRAEHVLLGVIRVADSITSTIVSSAGLTADTLKEELAEPQPPVPRSIEIPFHSETKRVFQYAADEAD